MDASFTSGANKFVRASIALPSISRTTVTTRKCDGRSRAHQKKIKCNVVENMGFLVFPFYRNVHKFNSVCSMNCNYIATQIHKLYTTTYTEEIYFL